MVNVAGEFKLVSKAIEATGVFESRVLSVSFRDGLQPNVHLRDDEFMRAFKGRVSEVTTSDGFEHYRIELGGVEFICVRSVPDVLVVNRVIGGDVVDAEEVAAS